MKILAIETSCDETAAAVLTVNRGRFKLLSHLVSSQVKIHAQYGGIVPEVAARKQMEMIIPVIEKVVETRQRSLSSGQTSLVSTKPKLRDIDYLAVTQGPGLITSLMVGVETAKTLATVLNKPLVAVNHLIGHIYANWLPVNSQQSTIKKIIFPALALVISGGHTLLVLMKDHWKYKIIGQTLDDAAGEAFDKVAKILNLGYPGGPIISRLAQKGNPFKFDLPRPMIYQHNFDFSFSGLKTAVLYLTLKHKNIKTLKQKRNLCASFEQAVVNVLIVKTIRAAKKYQPRTILLGGGVAANLELREQLKQKVKQELPNVKFLLPELKFTGDNAAMIAAAAYFKILKKQFVNPKKLQAEPNLIL